MDLSQDKQTVCGLVLAGGQSKRMGTDKALLILNGQTVIERVVQSLASVSDELPLVVNEPSRYKFLNLPTVTDQVPNGGPLMALYSGLVHTSASWCLATACDAPLLQPQLLKHLLEYRGSVDAVLPFINIQPFPGLYSKTCITILECLLTKGRSAARDIARACKVITVNEESIRKLDPDLKSFQDLDTPNGFEKLQAIALTDG